tara:strand:+ start:331 stop:483 length:153 start_codon:yes stop_codon:yes gene_type:complete
LIKSTKVGIENKEKILALSLDRKKRSYADGEEFFLQIFDNNMQLERFSTQ